MKPKQVVSVLVVALTLTGCTSGTVTAPTQTPANQQGSTLAVDSTGPPSDTIPDGTTWQSVRARDAGRAAGLKPPELTGAIGDGTDATFSLTLVAGRFSIFVAPQRGVAEVGDLGTYSYRDDGALVTTSEGEGCPGCVDTIHWSIDGDTLSLTLQDKDATAAERFVINGTWKRLR